jgi:CheY-specific phosphatase CheX
LTAVDAPDELLEPFITAVATTFREMAGVEVTVHDASPVAGDGVLADVSAALRLDADVSGWLILSFPHATAAALAGRVLAGVEGEPGEGMIRDCASELLNVTAGQAKALLFGTPRHFTFTTPTNLTAGRPDAAAGWWVIRFDSDAGVFTLHLCPPLASAGTSGAEANFTGRRVDR